MEHYVINRDEYHVEFIEAIPPTRRDLWSILRGKYKPQLRIVERLTTKGFARVIRQEYEPKIREAMNDPSPLAGMFKAEALGLEADTIIETNRQVYEGENPV